MEDFEANSLKSNMKSKVTEMFVLHKLNKEGFKVRKCARKVMKWNNKNGGVFISLNNYGIEDILKNFEGDKDKTYELLKTNYKGLPDFICEKEGKIKFVEVKSNHAGLDEWQRTTIPILTKAGFEVEIWKVPVDITIQENALKRILSTKYKAHFNTIEQGEKGNGN